ncbi:LapA family protein [Alkalihalobacterium chitinilyticum]|uniref:Lipopolysaccharide assembly protein LapA domain-containing protein n=1 Tax=Alkalihalobacterium chitinilyticum TaxID=2980103 RepID=A0ABT5VJW9_9BACI|nr:lipopolysaccharide assembly protein LapA domain-containing protein [Alkalihalobacterium chitinilyticum]MDE5415032.1 lipopolysaccharide assembly protein LapA domain-containing protein [Alkalihalobacterium chitinilyticum]
MRGQWGFILGIIAALIIAIFAVINVEAVRVNYLFGTADWPLILVIIGSVLMGGIIVGAVGMVKVYQLQQEIKRLKQTNAVKNSPTNQKKKDINQDQSNKEGSEQTKAKGN